jgi:hypothetical protein
VCNAAEAALLAAVAQDAVASALAEALTATHGGRTAPRCPLCRAPRARSACWCDGWTGVRLRARWRHQACAESTVILRRTGPPVGSRVSTPVDPGGALHACCCYAAVPRQRA